MNRYGQLLTLIDLFKPETICEVGVHDGKNAVRMINQALRYRNRVHYTGYDLFQLGSPEIDSAELNVKPRQRMADVYDVIKSECPAANINLIMGNTRETLRPREYEYDFVFIDGGHSVETINNDYEKLCASKVIVLDDYYTKDANGLCPDTELYGCNFLVDSCSRFIRPCVLPQADPVVGGGLTSLVLII